MKFSRRLMSASAALLLIVLLMSCGENASGVAEFKTVNATASIDAEQNPLLADLATWTGEPCAEGSSYSIENDLVNVTVTSTANIATGTSLPLMLQKATIIFEPADDYKSPLLASRYSQTFQNLNGTFLPVGGSVSIPVEVVTHELKEYLGTVMVCQAYSPVYSYNVTISIDAEEQGTGKTGSMSAGMTVRFYDFAD